MYWKDYWTSRGLPDNAATPGTSNHGFGTCVDIWDVYQYPFQTVLDVMARHGFAHDFFPELWHFHHTSVNLADSGTATLIEEIEMTPDQDARLKNIEAALLLGGPSMPDGGKSLAASVSLIRNTLATTVGRKDATGAVVNVSQVDDNAQTGTLVRQLLAAAPSPSSPGLTVDQVVAALKPLFDALPAAVRARIIAP